MRMDIHTDGRTEKTEVTKLIAALPNFSQAPTNSTFCHTVHLCILCGSLGQTAIVSLYSIK